MRHSQAQTGPNTPNGEALLTKDELAARLKLTRRGVEGLMARRVIPVIRVGRVVRFAYPAVLAALARFEIKEIGRR